MPKQEKKTKKKAKRIEGGKKKVSKKKRNIQTYKWIKHMFAELDELKERLDLIERFLGGRNSMKKVVKENE